MSRASFVTLHAWAAIVFGLFLIGVGRYIGSALAELDPAELPASALHPLTLVRIAQVLGVFILVIGIGLLKRVELARKAAVGLWALILIASLVRIGTLVILGAPLVPSMMAAEHALKPNAQRFFLVVGELFWLALAAVAIAKLFSPEVRAEFHSAEGDTAPGQDALATGR